MTDILCISTTDWDEIYGSRQHIMVRLANAGFRVLFVERQVGPEHLIRNSHMRTRKMSAWKQSRLNNVQSNLWRWQPSIMFPGRYYSLALNKLNQLRLVNQIRPILNRIGFTNPILWIYTPHSSPLIGKFAECMVVYHCIERFSGQQIGYKKQIMQDQEHELLSKANLVFTHSEGLRQLYEPYTQCPIFLLPSAADVKHFQTTQEIHPYIDELTKPRILVMGTLDERIDLNLLENISLRRPDWQLILIGIIRSERANFAPLLRQHNVHHLDQQPFNQLPRFLNGADICLIPYVITGMTRYINPLKAYEYLAAGKPVVSVDLPELEPIHEWINIVKITTGEQNKYNIRFIDTIKRALQSDSQEMQAKRRQLARRYDWDIRVKDIIQVINNFFDK